MVKNIMVGLVCIFGVNMLFNMAKVNKLEQRIEKEEIIMIRLQEQVLYEEYYIDSLERVLIDLILEHGRK